MSECRSSPDNLNCDSGLLVVIGNTPTDNRSQPPPDVTIQIGRDGHDGHDAHGKLWHKSRVHPNSAGSQALRLERTSRTLQPNLTSDVNGSIITKEKTRSV